MSCHPDASNAFGKYTECMERIASPTRLDSRDLRSGMALIAAALAAEGESRVTPLETVERGYGSLVERLRSLGAMVEREA